MSDDERVRGRLVKCNMTEEEAEAKCRELGCDKYFFDSWRDTLANETNKYCFLNKEFYEVHDFSETKSLYGCKLIKLDDGSILFDAIYYNGGAHWHEVVEDALTRQDLPKMD